MVQGQRGAHLQRLPILGPVRLHCQDSTKKEQTSYGAHNLGLGISYLLNE